MTEGISKFLNLGVPLKGESEIKQQDATLDILTITGAVGQTGDFLVLQNSGGTERLVVDADGNMSITGTMTIAANITQSGGDVTLNGDVAIANSFGVTGFSTFTGGITQTGGDVTLNGDVTIGNSLAVDGGKARFIGGLETSVGGNITLRKTSQASFSKLHPALVATTPASGAGCITGDLFLVKCTTDVYSLALCMSGATTIFKRVRRTSFDVTIGSAS